MEDMTFNWNDIVVEDDTSDVAIVLFRTAQAAIHKALEQTSRYPDVVMDLTGPTGSDLIIPGLHYEINMYPDYSTLAKHSYFSVKLSGSLGNTDIAVSFTQIFEGEGDTLSDGRIVPVIPPAHYSFADDEFDESELDPRLMVLLQLSLEKLHRVIRLQKAPLRSP